MDRLTHTPGFAIAAERCRRAGQHQRAVALCRDGLVEFPRFLSARVTLGCALVALGELDEGRTELEGVLHDAPDNLAAIRALAELHDRTTSGLNDQSPPQAVAGPGHEAVVISAEEIAAAEPDEAAAEPGAAPPDAGVDQFVWAPVVELSVDDAAGVSPFEFGIVPTRHLAFGDAVSEGPGRRQMDALERFLARIEIRRARSAVA